MDNVQVVRVKWATLKIMNDEKIKQGDGVRNYRTGKESPLSRKKLLDDWDKQC